MKKLNSLLITFCMLATFLPQIVSAQDDDKTSAKFGIGISYKPFRLAAVLDETENVPPATLDFTINPSKGFQFSLEAGFISRNDKSNNSKYNSVLIGMGLLGAKTYEQFKIKGGLKLEYVSGNNTYEGTNGKDTKIKFNRIALGPVVEGEYFFSKHFSAGAEFGLKYSSFTSDPFPDSQSSDDTKISSMYTDSAIHFRVYF